MDRASRQGTDGFSAVFGGRRGLRRERERQEREAAPYGPKTQQVREVIARAAQLTWEEAEQLAELRHETPLPAGPGDRSSRLAGAAEKEWLFGAASAADDGHPLAHNDEDPDDAYYPYRDGCFEAALAVGALAFERLLSPAEREGLLRPWREVIWGEG